MTASVAYFLWLAILQTVADGYYCRNLVDDRLCYKADNAEIQEQAVGARAGSLYRRKLEAEALTDVDLLGSIRDEDDMSNKPNILNIRHKSSDFNTASDVDEVHVKNIRFHSRPNNIGDDFDIVQILNVVQDRRRTEKKLHCEETEPVAAKTREKNKEGLQRTSPVVISKQPTTYSKESLRGLLDKFVPLLKNRNLTQIYRPGDAVSVELQGLSSSPPKSGDGSQIGVTGRAWHHAAPNGTLTQPGPLIAWTNQPKNRRNQPFSRKGRGGRFSPEGEANAFRRLDPDTLIAIKKLTQDETRLRQAEESAEIGREPSGLGGRGRQLRRRPLEKKQEQVRVTSKSGKKVERKNMDEEQGVGRGREEVGREVTKSAKVIGLKKKVGAPKGGNGGRDGVQAEKNKEEEGRSRVAWQQVTSESPVRKNSTAEGLRNTTEIEGNKQKKKSGGFLHSLFNFWKKEGAEGEKSITKTQGRMVPQGDGKSGLSKVRSGRKLWTETLPRDTLQGVRFQDDEFPKYSLRGGGSQAEGLWEGRFQNELLDRKNDRLQEFGSQSGQVRDNNFQTENLLNGLYHNEAFSGDGSRNNIRPDRIMEDDGLLHGMVPNSGFNGEGFLSAKLQGAKVQDNISQGESFDSGSLFDARVGSNQLNSKMEQNNVFQGHNHQDELLKSQKAMPKGEEDAGKKEDEQLYLDLPSLP